MTPEGDWQLAGPMAVRYWSDVIRPLSLWEGAANRSSGVVGEVVWRREPRQVDEVRRAERRD